MSKRSAQDGAAEAASGSAKKAKSEDYSVLAEGAAKLLLARPGLPEGFAPKVGIILGSGMSGVAKSIEGQVVVSYADLPGFAVSTVSGHAGNMVLGTLNGVHVACMQGRVHHYEGGDPRKVLLPIYTLRKLGCNVLLATTAVGSTNMESGPGSIVVVNDHINLQGVNPLIGKNDPIGHRFPSMLHAYDPELRGILHSCAEKEGLPKMTEGVYLSVLGPSFETPAEIRAFKTMGADVVGMSLVSEIIAARHCGMKCAALSIVVNYASGLTNDHITHDETLHYTAQAADKVTKLTLAFVSAASKH